nr:PREDICTED: elongator complex protein 6-like [Bemisia tabaci]
MAAIKRPLFAENYDGKTLLIEEVHGSVAADFLLSSILIDQFQRNPNAGMCLVLFHNTLSHFNNICSKNILKLNLDDLIQNEKIVCIQAMESVLKTFSDEKEDNFSKVSNLGSFYFEKVNQAINKLIAKNVSHIYLVVESVSNLLYLSQTFKDVINFVQSCLNLSPSTLIVSSHSSDTNPDQKLLLAFLRHLANINIRVSGLKTGFSSDVSGNFVVEKKSDSIHDFSVHKDKFFFKLEENSAAIYDGVAPSFLK